MRTLNEILQETMLGAASKFWTHIKLPFHPIEARPDKVPEPEPMIDFHDEVMNTVLNNPIWRFETPTFAGNGVTVENVTCKVRGMTPMYMEMPVLKKVVWGPVSVESPRLGGEIKLPLTPDYMVKCRYVPFGSIKESSSGFWQLPAEVDQSFEMIFGYEFPLGRSACSFRRLADDAVMTENSSQSFSGALSPCDISGDKTNRLRLPSIRIVVCVSLVCCKERANFEPGEVLGAGRLYPTIMVVASIPLTTVKASVKLTRPTSTMPKMGDECMAADPLTGQAGLGSIFFTDRNFNPIVPLPFWHAFFDYHLIDPPVDEYQMVTIPKPGEKPRLLKKAFSVSLLDPNDSLVTFLQDVEKQPGQGEFDSIHIAPKMTVDPSVLKKNPGLAGLDRITMAPFCVHDCFHMHWRWATWHGNKSNRGWIGNRPFAQSGAPLVPGNQKITIQTHSPVSLTYTATAEGVPAGEWQVFLHHGGAYALYVGRKGAFGKDAVLKLSRPDIAADSSSWAAMYWWLRYGREPNGRQFERITWTQAQLDALREKGGAGKAAGAAAAGGR